MNLFNSHRKDGTEITCKFCGRPVWRYLVDGRIYDVGGETLHVANCDSRREHFRNRALDAAEERRRHGRRD